MRKKIFWLPIAAFIFLLTTESYSQSEEIFKLSGNVISKLEQKPVAGAYITLVGLPQTTSTDQNGNFYLYVEKVTSVKMKVSKEGFKPFTLEVNFPLAKPLEIMIEPEESTPKLASNVFDVLTTLLIVANPDLSTDDARLAAVFELIMREIINACQEELKYLDENEIRKNLISSGATFSSDEFDMIIKSISTSSKEKSMQFLSKPSASSKIEINCDILNAWVATKEGKQFVRVLEQLKLTQSKIASSASSSHADLYQKALDMFTKLELSQKLPAGAKRSRIMTYAIKNEWDVQIVESLTEYLEKDPHGIYAENAKKLLEKGKNSEMLKAIATMRSVLKPIWEKNEK